MIKTRKILLSCRSKLEDASKKYAKFNVKLAIVQVGNKTDSNIYVRQKLKAAEALGISTVHQKLSPAINELSLLKNIEYLNQEQSVNGIIVQLPFDCDTEISSNAILNAVDPHKDVDGLNDVNIQRLQAGMLDDCFIPCTPKACMALIESTGFEVSGKEAVVVGSSRLMGAPMATLLRLKKAKVTLCNADTKNLAEVCNRAELLVVAIGKERYIKADWVKKGAVVIDCGINYLMDGEKRRIRGDVDLEGVMQRAAFITPVPGGVGPVTVSMLMMNTIEAAIRAKEPKKQFLKFE